jgi:hypothetical protein
VAALVLGLALGAAGAVVVTGTGDAAAGWLDDAHPATQEAMAAAVKAVTRRLDRCMATIMAQG